MIHVKLIGMTQCLEDGPEPERLIARAGRVCYKSTKQGEFDAFIRARIREGHDSLLEHVSLTFEIDGISRACLAQLTRHRIASFSVQSQRRVDMTDVKFIVPLSIRADPAAQRVFSEAMDAAISAYEKLRELGIRKGDSRFVLPNATETKLVTTMNVRALRHFFKVRCAGPAQWEIRMLAEEMLRVAYRAVPMTFEDLYTRFVKGKDY